MPRTPNRASHDWKREHRSVARKTKSYPPPIQRELRRLWTAHLIEQAHQVIETEVDLRARMRGLVMTEYANSGAPSEGFLPPRVRGGAWRRDFLPVARREELLDELAHDRVFLNSLRNAVDRIAREGQVTKQLGARDGAAPGLLQTRFPRESGVWNVTSDYGFRVASFLEGKPDGLCVAVRNRLVPKARRVFDEDLGLGLDIDEVPASAQTIRILDWGCGPAGNLAVVLDAMEATGVRFEVTEVDVFRDRVERQARCVVGRYHAIEHLPPTTGKFDFVVLHMPVPGDGVAAKYRNIYKDQLSERELLDPGRRGPLKWRRLLRAYLRALPDLVTDEGEIVIVLPSSVRVVGGYRDQAALLAGMCDVFEQVGLLADNVYAMVETEPVKQPFVATARPKWIVIIARKVGAR